MVYSPATNTGETFSKGNSSIEKSTQEATLNGSLISTAPGQE